MTWQNTFLNRHKNVKVQNQLTTSTFLGRAWVNFVNILHKALGAQITKAQKDTDNLTEINFNAFGICAFKSFE